MAKYYYNGVLLPEIPVVEGYPYIFLYINSTEPVYRVCLSASKYFYQTSDGTMRPGTNTVKNLWLSTEQLQTGVDWQQRNETVYYWASVCHWANYDVPVDSQSGSTVYFRKTHPTLQNLYLVNRWQGAIGNESTPLTLTLDGCTPGNMLVLAYAVRGDGNEPELSDGWAKLGGGNNTSDAGSSDQKIYFAYKKATSDAESVTITQTIAKRVYAVCSEYYGVSTVAMRDDLAAIGTTNYTVTGTKTNAGDIMIYAVTSAYYGSGRLQTATPDDLDKIEGDSSAERLACWFDGGLGAVTHQFQTYSSTEAQDAVLECVQLSAYDRKYLIRSNSTLYTITDGSLSALTETTPTADVFRTYGVDDIPAGSLLVGLSDPEVLYWHDSTDELPKLTMTVTGTPPLPQMFTSEPMDLTHESIAGIDHAEVDAAEDVRFAITFDGGATWKAFDGSAWFEVSETAPGMRPSTMNAITAEQWAEVVVLESYRLRFWIPSITAYVKSVVIHYINP